MSKLAINCICTPMYTLFSLKFYFFFFYFLKVVTMDTKSRIIIYQHLFARFCIFIKDTIGYKRYNGFKKLAIPTT